MNSDNSFSKPYRILKTEDFSSVFALRKQKSTPFFHVLRAANSLGHPRLGMVVAKKVAKRAHERNFMKRVIRDWFRRHKAQMPANDVIVRVRVAFHQETATQAREQLAQLLLK